jgi:hypothetical protein
MAPLGALSQAWVSAQAALPHGWQVSGIWRFDDLWIALSEGPEFDDYVSGSGQYAEQAIRRLADRSGRAAGTGFRLMRKPLRWPDYEARVVTVVIVLALAACATTTGSNPPPGTGGPSGAGLPTTELGTFDQAALEAKFDTVFTHDDLTETRSRYTADYRLPLGLEFTVDPADETKRILETSLKLSTDRDESRVAIERTWFRLMLDHQPEALAWVRDKRDEYLAAPGPDVSIRSLFGAVCAGFFAFGSKTSPSGKATTMGYFVETQDANVNCHGTSARESREGGVA